MNNSKILITGGTGFAGSHLVELLTESLPKDVVHVTYATHIPEEMKNQLPAENFHSLDMTDFAATEKLLQNLQPTQIYHLASIATAAGSFEHAQEVMSNNVKLQLNLLEVVKTHLKDTRILIVGSADGYGVSLSDNEIPVTEEHPFRPVNPYGVSKITQELLAYAYAQSWKLDVVIVRPFNHIGERQVGDFAVPAFAQQIVAIEKGEQDSLKVGNLEATRDFTDVKDMVKAYQLVMEKGKTLEVYNIGSGKGVTMQHLLDVMRQKAQKDIPVEVDQARLRPLDIPVIIANNDKVSALGWQPSIPIEETIERVLAYWRAQ